MCPPPSVTVATTAAVVVVAAPTAITVAVVVAAITVDAAGNAVGGRGGAELMGLALSCAYSLWRPPQSKKKRVWWRYLMRLRE